MSNKSKQAEDQKMILNCVESINSAFQAYDFELGDGINVPKMIRHDGYNYSIKNNGYLYKFNISVEPIDKDKEMIKYLEKNGYKVTKI